ncbi:hypothetical protein, variant [Phytophthora nicotianae]|uniref:Uncharacterized protein n=1 Tax=Phytophthora nicotianae TaxID=4792 RepID=W2ND27_PHYNI|nr:hypothetical protein L914_08608 [Phytophthora nicotianae]ETM46531.1 hypothetical protein, variant [Phytophthora nicotianae]
MPRSNRADGHDAEATVSTKLRAQTSKIVDCVAKYFEELEADVSMTRQRSKREKRQRSTENLGFNGVVAQHGGKGYPGHAEKENCRGDIHPRRDNAQYAEDSVVGGCSGRVGTPKGGSLLESKSCSTQAVKKDALACHDCVGSITDDMDDDDEHHSEQYWHLTTLDLPETPSTIFTVGYAGIKQSSDKHLRELIETLQAKEEDIPNWNAAVPGLWSYWETRRIKRDKMTLGDFDQVMKTQKPLRPLSTPRRMQCDWCETLRSSENFLYDESSMLLRKIDRANVQMLLLKKDIVVPNVFEADWGRSLLEMRPPRSSVELQQLLLPFELVRCDDARIIDAPSEIVSLADSYLRSLRRPDISLTRAAMNIRSVWNTAIVTNRLATLVAEERPSAVPQPTEPEPPFSSAPRNSQLDRMVPERAGVSEPISNYPVPESRSDLLNTKIRNDGRRIAKQTNQPLTVAAKLKVIAEDNPPSTDYFLSDGFLQCTWSEPPTEVEVGDVVVREEANTCDSNEDLKRDQLLQQLSRPALWGLMRKKLLQVDQTSFQHALNRVSLEALEAIILQQFQKVKSMSLNPSAFSSFEIVEVCTGLRQAAWLHTLRIVSITQARNGDVLSADLVKILSSAKYKHVLGSSNRKDLLTYLQMIGGNAVPSESIAQVEANASTSKEDSTLQPASKRRKVLQAEKESVPVRVLCSVEFLEQDDLLDELCTEQQIFFADRDLPPPIDILVDERNCICVVNEVTFQAEANTRNFILSLARLQIQLKKCWLVIALRTSPSAETEDIMHAFLAALVQFRIEVQVLTSFSCEETGRLVRAVVDECADVALNDHRILPRLWFERPFLLEEVSQFERFLVSTNIVNHYAAQSLLHKISMNDLFSKSLDELKLLVQNAVTDEQLDLLWRLVQQDHGLNGRMQ